MVLIQRCYQQCRMRVIRSFFLLGVSKYIKPPSPFNQGTWDNHNPYTPTSQYSCTMVGLVRPTLHLQQLGNMGADRINMYREARVYAHRPTSHDRHYVCFPCTRIPASPLLPYARPFRLFLAAQCPFSPAVCDVFRT